MKKVKQPSAIFKWKGKLVKVVGINPGMKAICMEYLNEEDSSLICPHCGKPVNHQFEEIEESPLFQENAEKITTLED
jgi:hypothetical protein